MCRNSKTRPSDRISRPAHRLLSLSRANFILMSSGGKSQASSGQPKVSAQLLGIEDALWSAADHLRGNLDPTEYRHIVLGLVVLRHLDVTSASLEVPPDVDWGSLAASPSNQIGRTLDDAMESLELANPRLRGALPRGFARLDPRRLSEVVKTMDQVDLAEVGDRDVLGRVYEYFLSRFAAQTGRGEFYTPQSVVKLLVALLLPQHGSVYDPCCGTGGMFVQSQRAADQASHGSESLSVYGQEMTDSTWRLARLNMVLSGLDADLGERPADTFHNDLHPSLKADFILANPPFNQSDWGSERLLDDDRWAYGMPSAGNANFAWLQHILSHLSDAGRAAVVLSNGSLSANQYGEKGVRARLLEGNVVEAIVGLPAKLFYATQIAACVWVLAKREGRARRDDSDVLFIDASSLGHAVSRAHRTLSCTDTELIAHTYASWRAMENYEDSLGFCRSVARDELQSNDANLSPGRWVGTAEEAAETNILALVEEARARIEESRRMDPVVLQVLNDLGSA